MPDIKEFIPFLIPLAIVQMGLLAYTLYHILTHKTYKRGSRGLWLIVALAGMQFIGPLLSLGSHLFLHNGHHTIGCDCGVNLDPDGIFAGTPEFFNLEMLLQPFEEQLDLPSIVVQFSDHHRTDIQPVIL